MANLFNPDGRVMRFITKIVHSVWLNILWFVCCIPIVTIGPATTALFYASLKIVRDEDGYVTGEFFRSFKENFKQAMVIGLIMTLLGVVMAIDGYALSRLRHTSAFWTLMTAVFLIAVCAYCIVLMWIFPLLAHFDNSTFAMFKNSIMLGIRFLFCTAFMAAIYFAMLVIIVRVMTPCVIFGMGTCAYLSSLLLNNILVQLEGKTDVQEDSEDEGKQF